MTHTQASFLKMDDVVDVMGLEYKIVSVETDNRDTHLTLQYTSPNIVSFIYMDLDSRTLVYTK